MALAPWKRYSLLSFDGGGTRIYASLLILERLMKYIGEAEMQAGFESSFSPYELPKKLANYPAHQENIARRFLPCHYFDTVIGTSTGGLLAIMLARFRMTAPEAREKFVDLQSMLFNSPLWFRVLCSQVSPLRGILSPFRGRFHYYDLKDIFRQLAVEMDGSLDQTFGFVDAPFNKQDWGVCKTIVTALGTDSSSEQGISDRIKRGSSSKTLLFQTYDSPVQEGLGRSVTKRGFPGPVWTVARACASSILNPMKIQALNGSTWQFKDAALRVNNPTQIGVDEIREWGPKPRSDEAVHAVVSIGTSIGHTKASRLSMSNFRALQWLATFRGLLIGAVDTDVVHRAVQNRLQAGASERRYWRFNDDSELWKGVNFGKLDRDMLNKIESLINEYLGKPETQEDLKMCANCLVKQRHERLQASREMWERFANATEYISHIPGCFRRYNLSGDIKSHFDNYHRGSEEDVERLEWVYRVQKLNNTASEVAH